MVTILSGGSGNDAILKALIYKAKLTTEDIRIIVNAYDNGKSTGVCRSITNTLGVSDIRKNHYKLYKYSHEIISEDINKFYASRIDLNNSKNMKQDVINFLKDCSLDYLTGYSNLFFNNIKDLNKNFNFSDFSIANLVYSSMYKAYGYEYTNKYFCKLLNICDCVLLNSFDNVYIDAITNSGSIIKGEENIVDYCNDKDSISDIIFSNYNNTSTLNKVAIDYILNSDIIIISTGTFWSSIYPTLFYKDFYKYLNKSKAKKIWFINTIQDKDSYGVSSNDFINILSSKGLNLQDFLIVENKDADNMLNLKNNLKEYNIVYEHLGNIDGKNNYELVYNFIKDYI